MTRDDQVLRNYEAMQAIAKRYDTQLETIEINTEPYLIEIPNPEIALQSPRFVITKHGIHTISSPNAGNLVWSYDYQLLEQILLVANQQAIEQLGLNNETYSVCIQMGRQFYIVNRYLLTDTKAIEELDLRKPDIESEE